MPQRPWVTIAVLLLCGALYLAQAGGYDQWLTVYGALWPLGNADLPITAEGRWPVFAWWQLLSYGFLHGSPPHLFFNLFALWMFGNELERFWGSWPYLRFLLAAIIGAGVAQLIVAASTGEPYPTVGISGGVYGVLIGYGLMFPNRVIVPLFPPIPMRARYAVWIFAAIELWLGVFGSGGRVAHFAHLGGLATGWLIIQYWRGRLPIQPRRRLQC